MPPKVKSRLQLLVEGKDDQHSIINLLKQYGVNWDDRVAELPYVKDCSGRQNLLEHELPLILQNRSAYSTVGIVIDADESCENCWESVRSVLIKHGVSVPQIPEPSGSLIEPETGIRVGVWIMPDNRCPGKLEDFLGQLVPPDNKCWDYCESVLDEALDRGALFAEKDRPKAKIHTWLAWQEKPGLPFGQAITANCLNADCEIAELFVKWFYNLFRISHDGP